ncbi:beta-ketoacyl-[acyl-carrier-protein] synthase II [Betaproteobacteria bacterium]|nr:beta-ketoacyl-[acyl-carrier-protein] synthase II [Betaproteobacteria bacterium]GHU43062.1 beta-ketoacyl-[acyl-carrier-protein] synthase II [Betaproteobacteria bacterium]
MNSEVYLHAPGVLCALGDHLPDIRAALFVGESPGMRMSDAYSPGRALCLGLVDAKLPDIDFLPREARTRNNALLLAAFARIEADYRRLAAGLPPARIAVVLGTSTSGIFESEAAVRVWQQTGVWQEKYHYLQQELGSPAQMLARVLGVEGAAYTVSTACTSSAKALICGARLLRAGLADLVLAGGVDTLTRFTVAGFSALEAVSPERCLPFSQNRAGINIGEAAALIMMSREKPDAPITLSGWGESSDGYHISAPDPSGAGAKLAIHEALTRANIDAAAIGYVNLHGTATQQNDAMESRVMAEIFPGVPMSSTKPLTGHTLGAAGALEAALCWLTLTDADCRLPPQLMDHAPDAALPPLRLVAPATQSTPPISHALSTSFAFGGSNAALILERKI